MRRDVLALRVIALLLGAVHLGFFAFVVVQRFRYPVELEWMSGGVWDHVARVMHHEPLYAAPDAGFIAYLYPPLHYWLSALFASFMSIPAACRVVSVMGTVFTAAMVLHATRKLTGSLYWALVGLSLYVGAYSLSGFWYDLDRSDSLMTAMVMSGFVLALATENRLRLAAAGALLGAAFFAKQPAIVFFLAIVGAFVIARRIRDALVVLGAGLLVLVPTIAILSSKSDGWFWFYCWKMPSSHGIESRLITVFFVLDASKMIMLFGTTIAVLVVTAIALWKRFREAAPVNRDDLLLGALVAAGFFTSATSRLHNGGFLNVLMFLTTVAAVALPVMASRWSKSGRGVELALLAAICLQLLQFLYDPGDASPNEGRVRDANIVQDRIRELEQQGDVIVHGRAHITKNPHFHIMALMDVLRGGLPVPDDLRRGLSERKYAAYVVDEFGELTLEAIIGHRSELFELVTRNYYIAQRLDDREPPPLVGWIAHPSWILLPRKTALANFTIEQLERRQRAEMGIAEMHMRLRQAGLEKGPITYDPESEAAAHDSEK